MPEIRLALFDLDGTLITSYMDREDKNYHAWEFFPETLPALDAIRDQGVKVGIITNQAGIAFGYNTEEDFESKIRVFCKATRIPREHIWVCFHHPKADPPYNDLKGCLRRKPNAAMIDEARAYFGVSSDQTVFVGDMDSDRECARHARVHYTDAHVFFQRADPKLHLPVHEAAQILWRRSA